MIQAVVFDLWNTLVFNPQGNPFDQLKTLVPESQGALAKAFEYHVMRRPYPSIEAALADHPFGQAAHPTDLARWVSTFKQCDDQTQWMPQAQEILEACAATSRLALLSNTQSFGMGFMERLGLVKLFRHRYISAHVGLAKPDPLIFTTIEKDLSLFPGDFVLVGDTWADDVEGSLSAGWSSVWFNHKGKTRPHEKPLGPDFVEINSLHQLPKVIANLQAGLRCSQCLG